MRIETGKNFELVGTEIALVLGTVEGGFGNDEGAQCRKQLDRSSNSLDGKV